jgi:hypothetical protein
MLVNEEPPPDLLMLSPAKTLLAIAVMVQMLSYLLSAFQLASFEALRWALACSDNGVSFKSFLGLSRATSLMGVGYLFWERGTHHIWCFERWVT